MSTSKTMIDQFNELLDAAPLQINTWDDYIASRQASVRMTELMVQSYYNLPQLGSGVYRELWQLLNKRAPEIQAARCKFIEQAYRPFIYGKSPLRCSELREGMWVLMVPTGAEHLAAGSSSSAAAERMISYVARADGELYRIDYHRHGKGELRHANGALLTRVGGDPEYLYAITCPDAIRALTYLDDRDVEYMARIDRLTPATK